MVMAQSFCAQGLARLGTRRGSISVCGRSTGGCVSGQVTGVLWEPRRGRMTSAREDVTWNRCHLEVAFELAGPWWVGGMGRLEARAQLRAQHKGWRCRGRRGPRPGCSACLPWAQGGSLHRCCCSLLRAHQCTPNRTVVSPTATSSVTSASRGSLGRLGEEGPLLPWTLTLALRA